MTTATTAIIRAVLLVLRLGGVDVPGGANSIRGASGGGVGVDIRAMLSFGVLVGVGALIVFLLFRDPPPHRAACNTRFTSWSRPSHANSRSCHNLTWGNMRGGASAWEGE